MRKVQYETQEVKQQLVDEATANGEILIEEGNITDENYLIFDIPKPPNIDELKEAKMNELAKARDNALKSFVSAALGVEHTYKDVDESDHTLFNALKQDISEMPDDMVNLWYVVDVGDYLPHTKAQLQVMLIDKRTHFYATWQKHAALDSARLAATNKEDLDSIIWGE